MRLLFGLFTKKYQFFVTTAFLSHVLYACCIFSLAVHHSKFSTLLSVFIPFLWFTCVLPSGFWMNTIADKRWIKKCLSFLHFKENETHLYHFRLVYTILKNTRNTSEEWAHSSTTSTRSEATKLSLVSKFVRNWLKSASRTRHKKLSKFEETALRNWSSTQISGLENTFSRVAGEIIFRDLIIPQVRSQESLDFVSLGERNSTI